MSAVLILIGLLGVSPAQAVPLAFTDSAGNHVSLEGAPRRVVSLIPGITEIILDLGAGSVLKGVTYYNRIPPEAPDVSLVGGFLHPSLERIRALNPDVVFLSGLQEDVRSALAGTGAVMVDLEAGSLEDIYRHIRIIGAMFDRRESAEALVSEMQAQIRLISQKTARIPKEKRLRVMRLMGRDQVMSPGDDSFQNDYIRAAGGIAPEWGRRGGAVPVTLEEWKRFNPQVIYGCELDRGLAAKLRELPGWNEVEAVQNGRILFFPCELTCRASVDAGRFVSWLAMSVYDETFNAPENLVLKEEPISDQAVSIDAPFVRSARVVRSIIGDFVHKTLVLDFVRPTAVLSTLEGRRDGVATVGNHYVPPEGWGLLGRMNLNQMGWRVAGVIGRDLRSTSLLFTGADMDHLSVKKAKYQDLTAYVLATAGVQSNAMRMSADRGDYVEPGTINIIILTNRRLTDRAMARAIITATEAKTAALQDLDIRSTYQGRTFQATGTGTDNLIVVQGDGAPVDLTGGHSKMGELIARAVYDGVRETIAKQNGLTQKRSIFQRLAERRIDLFDPKRRTGTKDDRSAGLLTARLEHLLLDPRYASFVESAFSLEDAWQRGQLSDLVSWREHCLRIQAEVAGSGSDSDLNVTGPDASAGPLDMALQALWKGVASSDYAGDGPPRTMTEEGSPCECSQ